MLRTYQVRLDGGTEPNDQVIAAVRRATDLGRGDATELVQSGGVVAAGLSEDAATRLATNLSAAGAEAAAEELPPVEPGIRSVAAPPVTWVDALSGDVEEFLADRPRATDPLLGVVRAAGTEGRGLEGHRVVLYVGRDPAVPVVEARTGPGGYFWVPDPISVWGNLDPDQIETQAASGPMLAEYHPAEAASAISVAVFDDDTPFRTSHESAAGTGDDGLLTVHAGEGRGPTNAVEGIVTRADEPVDGVVVTAIDEDPGGERVLGTDVARDGRFRVPYAPRAEAEAGPDVRVRVADETGRTLAESDVVADAARICSVDVAIPPERAVTPTEFDRLRTVLTERAGVEDLAAIDDDSLAHLRTELALDDRPALFPVGDEGAALAVRSAQAAAGLDAPAAAFYAAGRGDEGRIVTPSALAEKDPDELRAAVELAVEEGVVSLDDEAIDAFIAAVRRSDAATGEPAPTERVDGRLELRDGQGAGSVVEVLAEGEDDPEVLDEAVVGPAGEYELALPADATAASVQVRSPDGAVVERNDIQDDGAVTDAVPDVAPGTQETITDPTMTDLAATELPLTESVAASLSEAGLETLGDVRRQGGLASEEVPDVEPETATTLTYAAHLQPISLDLEETVALADAGFDGPLAVAAADPATLEETLGSPAAAAEAATRASAGAAAADGVGAQLFTERANRTAADPGTELPVYTIRDGERQIAMSSGPVACDCADCDSALGTPAYLADLLEFTTRAATKNGDELTLQPLVDNFYQPFEELPATCAAAQPDVTQARIAVEVLTQHVSQSTLDSLIAPDDVGGTYRRAVYEALLEEHGTSFAELREVLAGSDDEQERLAARLGISKRDLEDLLLDPTADPTASDAVSPAALEEIFGYEAIVEVTQGSSGPTVSVLDPLRSRDTPKLQEWRESELWLQWNGTDHPSDPIASSSVPIVDPDVVGPDDFRDPTSGTVHWDLWTKRRSWLDDTIADFRSKGSIADLFAAMRSNFDYDGTQRAPAWLGGATASTLEDHYRTLQGRPGASGTPEASREYVTDRLRLPVEAFMHLMEIREEVPAGQSKPDEDEWRDVCSILAGARKRSLFGAWEAAEHSAGFELGPKQFWPSLREPDTGRWSGVLDDDHASTPFVDPDHVDRDDLRERPHGEAILTLYEQRRQTLADQPAAFRQTYEADDVDTVLDDVYGSVPDGTDWESYLDGLAASLRATDPSTVETAETTIEGTLHLDLDAFEAVHAVRDADAAGETPDSDELGAAFAALVTPWKREQRYADWVTAEGQAVSGSRTYWKLLRARLPEWRTATEDRRVWRDGLAARREPPVVDPDMVRPDIFEPFTRGNPAKEVWRRMQNFTQVGRGPDLESEVTSIETRWQGASDPLQAFDDLLDSYVGIAGQTLTDLAGRRAGGAIIEGRLDQLDLTPAGFEYLAERRDRLDGGPGLTDEEWHNVTSILVAVWKRRQHAEWHEEEVNRGVSLRPELFRLPEGDLVPDDVPEHVERWRIDGERVRDWVDRLEERIETLDDVERAIRDAVHAVEESELPGLRDDLIREAHPNADLATKADELTERLLMPMRNDGCRRTSRIAQAVGSVQRLLLALRNGEDVAGSAIELQLDADAYDEAWTWLESHQKWRSAMKTFLYPENMLQGTHRRGEVTTPLFAELVEDLRDPGLTPSDACRAAERYTAYIKDLASIHVEASCWAPVPAGDAPGDCDVTPEGQPRELFYMFGVGGETGRVYWARYDPQARGWQEDENWAEHHDHPLTFWQPLEAEDHGLGDVEGIVGVDRHGGEPYLVLSTAARGGRQLAIVRFDPIDDAIASAAPLSVPDHAGGFSAAVVQRPAGGVGPPLVVLAVPDDEGTQLHATDDDIIFSEGRRSFMYYENQIAGPGGGWQRGSWNRLLVFGRRLAQDAQLDLASAIEVDGRLVLFTNLPRPDRPRLTETDVVSITPESRAADFPDRVQGRLDQFRDYNKKRQQLEVARLGRDRTQSEYDRAERRVSSLENQLERQLNTLESRLSDIHTVHDFSIPPGPVEDTLKDRSKSVDDLGDLLEVFIGSNGAYDGPPKAIVQAWVEGILSLREDKQPRVGGQSLEDFLSGFVATADSLRQAYDARDSVSDRLERARESVQRHQRELEETAGYRLVEGFNEWRKGVTLTRSHPLGHVQATIYRPEYGTDQMTGLFVVSSTGPPEDRTTFVHLVRSVGEDMFDNIVRQDYNVPRDMSLVDVATHGGPTMADGYGFVVAELDGPNHFGGPMVHSLGDTSPFGTLVYRSVAPQVPSPPPTETPKLKWKAHGDGALPVSKGFDAERQASRREWIDGVGCHNGHRIETVFYLKTNQIYLWEAYFFLPMLLGRRLQRAGQYNEALDWFRTVYDYTLPEDDRKIFHRLHREEYYGEISSPKPGWLGDDVGPHVIAAGRTHAYTRFTVFSIVQCLLDHADAEFGHSATESIARARDRYLQAEDLLEVPAVDRSGQPCRDVGIEVETNVQLSVDLGDYLEAYWIDQLQQLVTTMDSYVLRKTATQKIQAALDGEEDPEVRLEQARGDVLELGEGGDATVGNVLDGSAQFRRRLQDAVVADDGAADVVTRASENAMADGPAASAVEGTAWDVDLEADGGAAADDGPPVVTTTFQFCVPNNPRREALASHTASNLDKIRNCRNMAGLRRDADPFAGGTTQVTDYRYEALIERAKDLANRASKVESEFLSAVQQRDQARYELMQARQDVQLASARTRTQALSVSAAEAGVDLAEAQLEKSRSRWRHYQRLLDESLTRHERKQLQYMENAAELHADAAETLNAGGAGPALSMFSISAGTSGPGVSMSPGAYFSTKSSVESKRAAAKSAAASYFGRRASFRRRSQRWRFQRSQSEHDRRIGAQQVQQSQLEVDIARQRRRVAELQTRQARDSAEFLATQFTSAELYDWMDDVLERVYRYFLHEATAVANRAEAQLAFQRQELPQEFVQADYWEASADGRQVPDPDGDTDRRGLTGSARLLQDIHQLDQFEFRSDERTHSMRATLSLAQLAPVAFQEFRETGVLQFSTPMELFERHNPGQYMRLVSQVRPTLVALTSPNDQVNATLSSSGISRVVTGGDRFSTRVLRREPESMTLSGPGEGRMRELEPDRSEKLRPFEKMGVDTTWELRMPKAANQFDFDTIADVLLQIDYTALSSATYRQQVVERLDRDVERERTFSLRHHVPQAWYDLNNPSTDDDPMTVSFAIDADEFPPNVTDLRTEDVVCNFAGVEDALVEDVDVTLGLDPADGPAVEGTARPVDGLVSTRRPGGTGWLPIANGRRSPVGTWTISLPDEPRVRRLFAEDHITDLQLVIGYEGRLPEWPSA